MKKKPLRMCICCRQMLEKDRLLRVVRTEEGFALDKSGKMDGRGAYLCLNKDCLTRLKKTRALNRAFKGSVDALIYEQLESYARERASHLEET